MGGFLTAGTQHGSGVGYDRPADDPPDEWFVRTSDRLEALDWLQLDRIRPRRIELARAIARAVGALPRQHDLPLEAEYFQYVDRIKRSVSPDPDDEAFVDRLCRLHLRRRAYRLALRGGDLCEALSWVDGRGQVPRQFVLVALLHLVREGRVSAEALRGLLAQYWVYADNPAHFDPVSAVRLFRMAGFVSERRDIRRPRGLWGRRIPVFRAAEPGHKRGVSWTLSREVAEWFAKTIDERNAEQLRRHPGLDLRPAGVYAARVAPRDVLGVFHRRHEAEIVVDPDGLQRLRELRRWKTPPKRKPVVRREDVSLSPPWWAALLGSVGAGALLVAGAVRG